VGCRWLNCKYLPSANALTWALRSRDLFNVLWYSVGLGYFQRFEEVAELSKPMPDGTWTMIADATASLRAVSSSI